MTLALDAPKRLIVADPWEGRRICPSGASFSSIVSTLSE